MVGVKKILPMKEGPDQSSVQLIQCLQPLLKELRLPAVFMTRADPCTETKKLKLGPYHVKT
jgi:hypothetical protein